MPTVHAEVEAKYDVDDDFEVPGLVELLGAALAGDAPVAGVEGPFAEGERAEHDLSATYYDTPDLRLAAAGLTLRRRTGGDDAGWHLKVPVARSRTEVRLPLEDGAGAVPDRLRAMTHARTGGAELVPVARVDTHRTVRRLVDPTGRVLLEVADDRVAARRLDGHAAPDDDGRAPDDGPDRGDPGEGAVTTWREIEVEVVDGPPALLEAVDPVLRERGLRPAGTASKLRRALGPDAVGPGRPPRPPGAGGPASDEPPEGRRPSAADVVLAHLGAQVEQIRAQDLPVRLDAEGAVHAMRVATRRLRSALTTFGPLLRRSVTRPVARELKWLAGVLGEARDAEVMRARITDAVAAEARQATPPPAGAADDVSGRLQDAYAVAHRTLLEHLDGPRYRALLGRLGDLVERPPLRTRAGGGARGVLPSLVAAGDAEVRAAMSAARRAADPDEREELLHEARKAAKRARYAAEAVTEVVGEDARRYAEAMEGVQEAVGEHLDARNTRAQIHDLAEQTTLPAAAFTLGRLHAREDVRVEQSWGLVDEAWATARRKRLRRWLR